MEDTLNILGLKNCIPLIFVIVVVAEWSQTHVNFLIAFDDKNETLTTRISLLKVTFVIE